MSSFLGGGGSGGGGGGSPGGSNTDIQFNNSGSFGGDANLTWTIGSAFVDMLDGYVGNASTIGQVTWGPGDPVSGDQFTDNNGVFNVNNYFNGDFFTNNNFNQTQNGVYILNGYTNTSAPGNFASIQDFQIGPQINSNATGPIHDFYTLILQPSNFSTTPLDNFRCFSVTPFQNCAVNITDFWGIQTQMQTIGGGSGNISLYTGHNSRMTFDGTGTVGNMTTYGMAMAVTGGGTVTTMNGIFIATPAVTSGTVTDNVGLVIEDQSGIGSTQNWNLWSTGSASINRFEGTIQLGFGGINTGVAEFFGQTSGNAVTVKALDTTGAWTFKWPTSAGTANFFLQTDGAGNTTWAAGGSGSPGGSSGEVQYNNSGAFGGAADFTISSGQPNVAAGFAYLYNSINAIFSVANVAGDNWFLGGAGNMTTTGDRNFCEGPGAGGSLTTGDRNMAQGSLALASATSAADCVALGASALNAVIDGRDNLAVGTGAMQFATTGNADNVAVGVNAFGSGVLVGATQNLAIGSGAGQNSAGSTFATTFIGTGAGSNATASQSSTIIGNQAAQSLTTPNTLNTIIGAGTGAGISTGNFNTIIGAGITGLSSGLSSNVILGNGNGTIVFQYDDSSALNNLSIGRGASAPGPFNSMSIQDGIYGTGNFSGSTIGWIGIGVNGAYGTERLGVNGTIMTNAAATMIGSNTSYTNGAASSLGTLTNAPAAGNPTKWIPVNDAGTIRFIPAW